MTQAVVEGDLSFIPYDFSVFIMGLVNMSDMRSEFVTVPGRKATLLSSP